MAEEASEKTPKNPPPPRGAYVLWIALFIIPAVSILTIAGETAWHFNGSAIDGPFQLYDALRRIQGGFKPGVDFQYFHGLGLAYLHYPLYRIFGGDLAASELSRELIAAALFPTVYLLVFWAFTRSWLRAFCLSVAAVAFTWHLRTPSVVFALSGMIGVRSAVPTLLPLAMLLPRTRAQRIVATGATIGLALFVSTEQGLAAFAAYLLVSALAAIRRTDRRERAVEYAATVATTVVCTVILFLIIGGPAGAVGALRYSFRTLPMDQYWYFGAPPNLFLSSWGFALRAMLVYWRIGAAVALAVALAVGQIGRLLHPSDAAVDQRQFAVTVLAVYGFVSCFALLGIFNFSYTQSCWRVIVIIALLEVQWAADRFDRRRFGAVPRKRSLGVPPLVAALSLFSFVLALLNYPVIIAGVGHAIITVPRQLLRREPFTMNAMWTETLGIDQRVIASHRTASGQPPVVWSTYAGWAEARAGIYQPSLDYIIHALGPTLREQYVSTFRNDRPVLVQTVRPSYTMYEPWLENENWPFYSELLRWYQPAVLTPWSIWWERRPSPAPEPRLIWSVDVKSGRADFARPPIPATNSTRLLEVEIAYEVHNPLRALPIVGANPRYLVYVDSAARRLPISLDPYVDEMRFPLVVGAGEQPFLRFETFSLLPGAWYRVKSIRLFERPMESSATVWFQELLSRL